MVVLPIEDDDAVHACKSAPSLLLLGAPGGGDDKSLETARRNMSVLRRRRRPSSVLWSSFRSFRCVCVCVLCFEEEEQFHHHPFFFVFFCFSLVSFLTSLKNFTFFIDDFQARFLDILQCGVR